MIACLLSLLLRATPVATEQKPAILTCRPDKVAFQQKVGVQCVLTNLLDEPLLVMLRPPVAEGPTEPGRYYFYGHIFWHRYENVFQYDRTFMGSLDKPILGKPVVHLTSEVIQDLRQLPAKGCIQFAVRWNVPSSLPRRTERWHARVKVIAISASRFASVVRKTSPDCQLMASTFKKRVDGRPIELDVHYRVATDPSYNEDRCHDVISEAFEHIPSPPFRFTTTPAAPPPAAGATRP
ncbi:MAG TPA: hypothetical protein VJ276_14240 [Thermoanaerobaculia bacterium]|nr:hypothetical protein [Thermoanaerobaculia bacterium]